MYCAKCTAPKQTQGGVREEILAERPSNLSPRSAKRALMRSKSSIWRLYSISVSISIPNTGKRGKTRGDMKYTLLVAEEAAFDVQRTFRPGGPPPKKNIH